MDMSLALWAQLYLYPLIVTLALWGGLTLGLVWLNHQGTRKGLLVLLLLTPLLVLAHVQLWETRNDLSTWGCYRAFLAGLFIWSWHELAFYSGLLRGPRRSGCPPDCHGWRRFGAALQTHLYHEAAIVVEAIVLLALHMNAHNLIGPLTVGLSWALQHSAKLNVLLGVNYLEVSLLPEHLRYLATYWKQRPSNPFFLASVLIGSGVAAFFWIHASMLAPSEAAIGMTLLATLTTLGVLEHWLLVLPARSKQASQIARATNADPPLHPDS
jgi:putative photosynthetic complex assembly protein 2